MSQRHVPWLVRASAALYRRLFVLYPLALRQECAADMAQVFTDLAREAHRHAGAVGVFALWGRALTDLVVTALAERSAQMSNRTAQRLGGLCLMIGSSLGGLALIVRRMLGFADFFGVQGEVWLSVAAVLFIPGIIALHLWLVGAVGGGGGWVPSSRSAGFSRSRWPNWRSRCTWGAPSRPVAPRAAASRTPPGASWAGDSTP